MTKIKVPLTGVEDNSRLIEYKNLNKGDCVVVGRLLEKNTVTSKDGNNFLLYTFETEEGEKVKIFGTGQLNFILKTVEIGTLLEIIYLGKESTKLKTGMSALAHQFEVSALQDANAEGDVA